MIAHRIIQSKSKLSFLKQISYSHPKAARQPATLRLRCPRKLHHAAHIILKCESHSVSTLQGSSSQRHSSSHRHLARNRRGIALATGRVYPGGFPLDRPAHHRGPHRTPPAGMDTRQAVSPALSVHSSQAKSRLIFSTRSSPPRTPAFICTMASIGTPSSSPPKTMWTVAAFAAVPPLPSN